MIFGGKKDWQSIENRERVDSAARLHREKEK
jgi:hypothetical protein